MSSFLFAFNAVMPIVLIVALGYILKRVGFVSKNTAKELNKVVFKVLLPANLFLGVYRISSLKNINFVFVTYAVLFTLAVFALGFVFVKFATGEQTRRGALLQSVFRSNYALIGIPLATALFGDAGLASAALLSAFVVPLYNILAVIALSVFEPDEDGHTAGKLRIGRILTGILKNPLVLSVFAGIAVLGVRELFVELGQSFRLADIAFAYSTLDMLAKSTTTLALIALGAQFEFSAVRALKKEICSAVAVRLVAVPLAAFAIAIALFDFKAAEYAAFIAAFASPVAVSSVPMAQEMHADAALAGQIVVWTTLISSVTLFGFIFVLNAIGVLV